MSSWFGASVLTLGELFIKKMPLVSYIHSASKQTSAAISPDQDSNVFKEVAIVRHPRVGEYVFGFITSSVTLQSSVGEEELCCVYVPTNHHYLGDISLVGTNEIIRPKLSVREGIEIVISGGMSIPNILTAVDTQVFPPDNDSAESKTGLINSQRSIPSSSSSNVATIYEENALADELLGNQVRRTESLPVLNERQSKCE